MAGREKYNFNSDWLLKIGDVPNAQAVSFEDSDWNMVTLPRAFNENESFKVAIDQLTDTIVWYRKHFKVAVLDARKVFVEFEGVRQGADFYLNGYHLGKHENGVMAVGFDLTPYMKNGDNVMAVRVDNDWSYKEVSTNTKFQWHDNRFNCNYGGIPKNVFLHVTNDVYQTLPLYNNLKTTGLYVYATDFDIKNRKAKIHVESEVKNDSHKSRKFSFLVTLVDADGKNVKVFKGLMCA